ncbi:MAG: beta-galactosidase BgaS [Thermoplasmataceae archaeon]
MLPKDFKFGFSEAGFQFEMGLSQPDMNSDWYKWVHDPENIKKRLVSGQFPENGPAYWDLYRKDHDNAKWMGMNSGRLGIEWSRIFPDSTESVDVEVNEDENDLLGIDISEKALEKLENLSNHSAVAHYQKIFEDFKSKMNYLVINLYHWTVPLWINDPAKNGDGIHGRPIGGEFERKQAIEFSKFAAYVAWKFDRYADSWCTMNEPNMVFLGCSHDTSLHALSVRKKNFAEAHARAYDVIKKISKKPVGIIYANGDVQPLSKEDDGAKNLMTTTERYSFLDSIIDGDLRRYNLDVMDSSKKSNDFRSDLKGRLDWIGVNYYSRDVVQKDDHSWKKVEGYGYATGNRQKSLDGRSVSEAGWEVYPDGIYNLLMEYHKKYHMPMMVTENGIGDYHDALRPRYLVSHIDKIDKAVKDGVKLKGYFHWALTDNYEWANGFNMHFGIYGFDPASKQRLLRPSAFIFKKITENNGVPDELMWMTEGKI